MMDHGFFDGPWRGGAGGSGRPWIFTDEGRAWIADRRASAIEARSDATVEQGAAEGESASDAQRHD